jgi:hypothetical protein
MDYSSMLSDSFQYAKDCVWGNARRWFLLVVSMIIFPFILGYCVRIYRGERPAPALEQWGNLFVDGLKLFVIELIYAMPVILLILISFLPFFSTIISTGVLSQDFTAMTDAQADQFLSSHPEILSALGTIVILIIVAIVLAIIIGIFSFIGTVRFARTVSVAEAFNFTAILATIKRIGWIKYLFALIVIGIIGILYGFVMELVGMIPVIGFVLWFILNPPLIIFVSRYTALVYNAGEEQAAMPPE